MNDQIEDQKTERNPETGQPTSSTPELSSILDHAKEEVVKFEQHGVPTAEQIAKAIGEPGDPQITEILHSLDTQAEAALEDMERAVGKEGLDLPENIKKELQIANALFAKYLDGSETAADIIMGKIPEQEQMTCGITMNRISQYIVQNLETSGEILANILHPSIRELMLDVLLQVFYTRKNPSDVSILKQTLVEGGFSEEKITTEEQRFADWIAENQALVKKQAEEEKFRAEISTLTDGAEIFKKLQEQYPDALTLRGEVGNNLNSLKEFNVRERLKLYLSAGEAGILLSEFDETKFFYSTELFLFGKAEPLIELKKILTVISEFSDENSAMEKISRQMRKYVKKLPNYPKRFGSPDQEHYLAVEKDWLIEEFQDFPEILLADPWIYQNWCQANIWRREDSLRIAQALSQRTDRKKNLSQLELKDFRLNDPLEIREALFAAYQKFHPEKIIEYLELFTEPIKKLSKEEREALLSEFHNLPRFKTKLKKFHFIRKMFSVEQQAVFNQDLSEKIQPFGPEHRASFKTEKNIQNLDVYGDLEIQRINSYRKRLTELSQRSSSNESEIKSIKKFLREVEERLCAQLETVRFGIAEEVFLPHSPIKQKIVLYLQDNDQIVRIYKRRLDASETLEEKAKIKKKIQELKRSIEESAVTDFSIMLRERKLPIEILEEVISWHKTLYEEKNKFWQEKELPKLIRRFKDRVQIMIEKDKLPITMEEIVKRLEGLDISLQDHLIEQTQLELPNQTLGYYRRSSHSIRVTQLFFDLQEKNLTHELVHATIAGRTFTKTLQGKQNKITENRNGLAFYTPKKKFFRWINEAMTEQIALRLLDTKDSISYTKEREKLEELFETGLDRRAADQAYCENYDPNLPAKDRLKGWRTMVKGIEGGVKKLRKIEQELQTQADAA